MIRNSLRACVGIGLLLLFYQSNAQTIRQKFAAITRRTFNIQNDTSLKMVVLQTKDFMSQQSDDFGTLTGYFRNDTLVKLDEELYLSYGGHRFICTFYNNGPDFAYTEEWHHPIDSLGNVNYTAVQVMYTKQYYFDSGKAIDSSSTGVPRFYQYTTSGLVANRASKARETILNKRK